LAWGYYRDPDQNVWRNYKRLDVHLVMIFLAELKVDLTSKNFIYLGKPPLQTAPGIAGGAGGRGARGAHVTPCVCPSEGLAPSTRSRATCIRTFLLKFSFTQGNSQAKQHTNKVVIRLRAVASAAFS
jgi:hypothetical protein